MDTRGYDFCCCYDIGNMDFCPFNLVFSFIIHVFGQLVLNWVSCLDQNKLPATLLKGQNQSQKCSPADTEVIHWLCYENKIHEK